MAQDPRKSNSSLQTASAEVTSFPMVSSTTDGEETLNAEDTEVSNNPDASNRLKKLSSQGLNPLKPVIIANTEFVPVGDGSSPDSTGLKAQIGENNLLSVNSVTKLFEIHRQVRLATLRSANMLLNRIKGYNASALLEELHEFLRLHIEDLATDDMSKTVDNVINKFINFRAPASFNTTTTTRSRVIGKNIPKSKIENKSFLLNEDTVDRNQLKLKTLFKNNKNDPYFRTIVEYAILEFVIFDILTYLSGILALKDTALKSWSILESLTSETIGGINAESLSSSSKFIFENATLSPAANRATAEGSLSRTFRATGIKAGSNTPDVSVLIQFFISAAESMLKMTSDSEKADPIPFNIYEFPIFSDYGSDVYDALSDLRNKYATSLYSDLRITHNDEISTAFDGSLSGNISDSNLFSAAKVGEVFHNFHLYSDRVDALGQMLGALIFNDCFEIAGSIASVNDKTKIFRAMGTNIPGGIKNIEDYYRELIVDPRPRTPGSNFEFSLESTESDRRRIVSYLSSKSDLKYIPFESTTAAGKIHNSSYLTGLEYFYDIAIQRGDGSLSELKKFVENYKNVANSYASDIYNLTRIDVVEAAAKRLLKFIGEEIYSTADENGGIFLLSLIAYEAGTDEGLLRLFRSAYFGSRLTEKDGKEGKRIGRAGTTDYPVTPAYAFPFKDTNSASAEEASRRAMRGANSILIKTLLKDGFDIDRSEINQRKKDSFLDMSGYPLEGGIDTEQYTFYDSKFDNISLGKKLNTGTDESMERLLEYKVYKQSGKKINSPTNGLNKEELALEGGANFSPWSSSEPARTIKYFLSNQHFVDVGLITEDQKKSFNDQRPRLASDIAPDNAVSADLPRDRIVFGVNYQGTGVSLADHHRAFILYSFVAKIIGKSLTVSANSVEEGGTANDAYVKLTLNPDEILGIVEAFKDVGEGLARRPGSSGSSEPAAYEAAYYNTQEYLLKFMSAITGRVKKISALTAAPLVHSAQLYNQYLAASKFISEGTGTNRDKLAISVLKNDKIKAFDNSLDLLSDEAVSQIYKSYVTTFLSGERSIYTKEDIPSLNQMKLMMKILTNPGYGLLSSEKRGPKSICHVGMTNSLMSTLRIEAYKEFNNKAFLESNRFCVNIFKRNEIDSQILVYPKTFLFDSSLMIIDNDFEGKSLNHISNFSDTWSFSDILNNIEFTTWSDKNNNLEDSFSNLKKAYSANYRKGSELPSSYGEDILKNHILDYAFKVYYRYALGLDLNENTFTLKPIRKNSEQVSGGLTVKSNEIQSDYENLINKTILLYPAANVDQKLASELFRIIQIIAASPVYSLVDKLKKVIYPKKFDKVFSILVNEKDFVLYTPAYDKNFIDVYKTEPSFSYTSKITRPDLKNVSSVNEKTINKYSDECEEDYPEVFSMYATITILPEGTK